MPSFFDLPDESLVRLKSIIGPGNPVPISRSTWFVWRKAGKAPPCIMLGARTAAYRVGDVKALVRAASETTAPRRQPLKSPKFDFLKKDRSDDQDDAV